MLALADDAALARLVIAAIAIPGRATSTAFRWRGGGLARTASNSLRTPDILKAPTKYRHRHSMSHPHRRRHGPVPDRRRALELLAASRDGAAEAIMIAHGFTVEQMVELINAGARNGKGRAHGRGLAQDRSRARADHGPGAAGAQR